MPHKYSQKPGVRRRNCEYSQMEDAIAAVVCEELNFAQAATQYNIHKTTLYDRYKGKYSGVGAGRKTALSKKTEQEILKFITTSKWGFPQTSQDFVNFVKHFLVKKDIF